VEVESSNLSYSIHEVLFLIKVCAIISVAAFLNPIISYFVLKLSV
jgi:hypothetical protein